MPEHDIRSDQIAAVDKLAHTCTTAIRALDQAVDTALAETLNYLHGAQVELDRLAARIMEAREQLDATRARWQGQRKLADAKPAQVAESAPPPAFLQQAHGQNSGQLAGLGNLGSNSGKHDTPRQ